MRKVGIAIILTSILLIFGCGSSKDKNLSTPDAIYNKAMEYYNDEDYLDAKELFDVFKLQYPANDKADDAQYYLSDIHYKMKEYVMAAFNFNRLRSLYPGSPYVEISLFMEGQCYLKLSPGFERDQDYTYKAMGAFQEYQYLYSDSDSLYKLATVQIEELRNKLARKEYSVAVLYTKLDDPKAAVVYFDSVIRNYDDTEYFEQAVYGKIEALNTMNKKDEIKNVIRFYKNRFPNGNNLNNVKNIESQLN